MAAIFLGANFNLDRPVLVRNECLHYWRQPLYLGCTDYVVDRDGLQRSHAIPLLESLSDLGEGRSLGLFILECQYRSPRAAILMSMVPVTTILIDMF